MVCKTDGIRSFLLHAQYLSSAIELLNVLSYHQNSCHFHHHPEEGAGVASVIVQRRVNPGTNLLFFSTTISENSAKGIHLIFSYVDLVTNTYTYYTCTAGEDYAELLDSRIGLNNNMLQDESCVEIAIKILDDDIIECNENFIIT